MSMQDPIADMFTRIRNAQARSQKTLSFPASRKKAAILDVLCQEGYIQAYTKESSEKPVLRVELKYYQGQPVIKYIKRISKPGLRVYMPYLKLSKVQNGLGIAIVSTPKGVMTDRHARKNKLGGEVIAEVL